VWAWAWLKTILSTPRPSSGMGCPLPSATSWVTYWNR
jgi:hypothetical protein